MSLTMASSVGTVEVTGLGELAKNLQVHDDKLKRIIAGEILYAKDEAVTYMKQNAPWTDRTGNARAGLHADARSMVNGKVFELILAHSVYYGIYLEVRFSGKYAIIMPTANWIGPLMFQRIASALQEAAK
jgi:hypothetical protein